MPTDPALQAMSDKYQAALTTAEEAAALLERFASRGAPVSPAQLRAVAQKIRREIHEAKG